MSRKSFKILFLGVIICLGCNNGFQTIQAQASFKVARLKYSGGGDWYNDPSALVNLMAFIEKNTGMKTPKSEDIVDVGSSKLFNYPFVFMTGHGRVAFTEEERENLRTYLLSGGFLYADDDYGMDKSFRQEMAKVFPNHPLQALPFSHELYHIYYPFPGGVPKIHEHDSKSPAGYAIVHEGRVIVFYTYETNPSDAWADATIHNDPPEKRLEAFKLGTNILWYVLSH